MNAKTFFALSLIAAAAAHAGARSSATYIIPTDTADAAGKRVTSASYTNDGSFGGIAGVAATATDTAKHGYIAQLTESSGLSLSAASLNVEETATTQLAAWLALDDATLLAVPPVAVAWSVQSGPLAGISASGLATAGVVYADTSAIALGSAFGYTSSLALTVADTLPDNFGSYARDAIDDSWQVQYFGLDSPLAAPTLDPDGDGQSNLFEFTAGLVPTDPLSRFVLTIATGAPLQKRIIFSPIVARRIYTVEARTSLTAGAWAALADSTQNDSGNERTVTDPNASGTQKFYRVNVSKP